MVRFARFVCLVIVLSFSALASAQITDVTTSTATPIPGAGHDYIKMLNETVNPASGSVSVRIQAPTPAGRHLSLPFAFAYDSNSAAHLGSFNDGAGGIGWLDNTEYLRQRWMVILCPDSDQSARKRSPRGLARQVYLLQQLCFSG